MYRRRAGMTGVVLAIFLAGCGGSHAASVSAGNSTPVSAQAPVPTSTVAPAPPATSTVPPSTLAVLPAPDQTPPAGSTAPRPAVEPVETPPAPAIITVKYQPSEGGSATATLLETGETKSLADGSAVFTGLADGTYTVQISDVFPDQTSGDVSIGGQTIQRTQPIAVRAGDQAVVVCDSDGCTGIA
jgi:hypothetical protein